MSGVCFNDKKGEGDMGIANILVGLALLVLATSSWGDAYKCKTPAGTVFQDTPCRVQSETVRTATDPVNLENKRAVEARLNATQERWSQEAAAAAQAQRIEQARQAAIREEQRKNQAIVEQQRLVQEVQAARLEAEAAKRAADRATAAANDAAAAAGNAAAESSRPRFCSRGWCN